MSTNPPNVLDGVDLWSKRIIRWGMALGIVWGVVSFLLPHARIAYAGALLVVGIYACTNPGQRRLVRLRQLGMTFCIIWTICCLINFVVYSSDLDVRWSEIGVAAPALLNMCAVFAWGMAFSWCTFGVLKPPSQPPAGTTTQG